MGRQFITTASCSVLVLTTLISEGWSASIAKTEDEVKSCHFPEVSGGILHQLGPNVAAWTCSDHPNTTWSSGDRVILATCDDDLQAEYPPQCVSTTKHTSTEKCGPPPRAPEHSIVQHEFADGTGEMRNVFGIYYECELGTRWLSDTFGPSYGKLIQCIEGTWTPTIHDVCDQECISPKNCDELKNLGFKESGEYMINPSGTPNGNISSVWCDLGEDDTEKEKKKLTKKENFQKTVTLLTDALRKGAPKARN